MLLDRESELRVLRRVLQDLHGGESRALVLRGEAGVGKSALLAELILQSSGCRVVQAAGIESERELAFAALHQVCAPLLGRLDRLPEPQQEALRTAFGLSPGRAPDLFVAGLAALGLFAEAALERPLVCVIEDAQWLDRTSAQVLAFVARRLFAESVAMIFAVREPTQTAEPEVPEVPELAPLDELPVAGLPDDAARALLMSAYRGPVDVPVLDRILAELRGNPLALLELPRGFGPSELTGGFGTLGGRPLPERIEQSFQRQIGALPRETQQLLLVAAAEPVGDPVLVWRAAELLGVSVSAAGPLAQATDLVEFGAQVRFRHPLVRSAIYRAAAPQDQRRAHEVLAQVTDARTDPDRRAWHYAQATDGPDERVAAELERSAGRAQARGGLSAAAAFLARASDLTPEPARRGERALAAAQAKLAAGQPGESGHLLALAQASPLDNLQRAEADLLRVQIAFMTNRGSEAPSLLVTAATEMAEHDVSRARETYLDAVVAAWFAAHLATGSGLREVAEAARLAPGPVGPPSETDVLLDALAIRFTDGFPTAAGALRNALRKFRDHAAVGEEGLGLRWHAYLNLAVDLWNDDALEELSTGFLELAREAGALALLPFALTVRISCYVLSGDLVSAEALLAEQQTVAEVTGIPVATYGSMLVAAWRGSDDGLELIAAACKANAQRGEGAGVVTAGWMQATLCNSLGRYGEALSAAQEVTEPPVEIGIASRSALVELITAAVRCGRRDLAEDALQRLTPMTQACGTDWALGLEARCRALLGRGGVAESFYREAIERLGRTRVRGEFARAHLVYGEWLRRANRRGDAREHLRAAHEMFTGMGAHAFANRAARELAINGETVRKRSVRATTDLTAQEAQIVGLVRDGLSNTEIAGRLFISPRTVEWHLSRIFAKLHITSRRQLRR